MAFAVAWVLGGGKGLRDYAASTLQPLRHGTVLRYDDEVHAIWSGWWRGDGYRLSNDINPAVVFLASDAARDCSLAIASFPLRADSDVPQRIYAALNGDTSAGPVAIFVEQHVVIAHVGDIVNGVNVLKLRLPDAHKTNARDERIEAIGLRSIEFVCRDGN
jgi:hypothetical protein